MPRSLQGRLLLLVIGAVVTLWAAVGLLIWQGARARLDDLLDGHLAQAAAILVVQQGNEISDDDFDIDAPALHHLAPKVAFQVLHEGALVMRSAKAPRQPFIPATAAGVTGFRDVAIAGVAWRVFGATGTEHQMQVYVAERIDSRQAILWAVLRGLTLLMLRLPRHRKVRRYMRISDRQTLFMFSSIASRSLQNRALTSLFAGCWRTRA